MHGVCECVSVCAIRVCIVSHVWYGYVRCVYTMCICVFGVCLCMMYMCVCYVNDR